MSATATNGAVRATDYDHGAERIYGAITATCDPRAGFADRVQAALRTALTQIAADPNLTHLLTFEPFLGGEATVLRYLHWQKRFGALLRRAAAESPETTTNPAFVEPALIGGLRLQISRRVLTGETARIEELLPSFTEYLLSYYLDLK